MIANPVGNGSAHLDAGALTRPRSAGSGPWTQDHRIALVLRNGVALTLMIVGWWMASGTTSIGAEVAWLSVAVLGLVVAGIANGLWLAMGYRSIVLARNVVITPGQDLNPVRTETPARPAEGETSLVTADAMSRYHRTDCQLVVGKELRTAARSLHEQSGRRPCEVCEP